MIQESRVHDQPTGTTTSRMPSPQREPIEYEEYRSEGLVGVVWSGVIAGTVAIIAAQVFFATLGLAIGLSIPGGAATAEGMGIFAGIWWLVTGVLALFIGGWVAGRYARGGNEIDSSVHGVMAWALATTLSVLFVTAWGGMLAGGAIGAMADDLVLQAQQPMQQVAQNGQTAGPGQVDQLTDTAAGAAWWTFFALLLGLVAAGIGGYVATPSETGQHTGGSATVGRSASTS